jgi:hypothetical protein
VRRRRRTATRHRAADADRLMSEYEAAMSAASSARSVDLCLQTVEEKVDG